VREGETVTSRSNTWTTVRDVGCSLAARSGDQTYRSAQRAGDVDATGPAAACTREGRRWRIELGSRSVVVGHKVGIAYLAVLMANPDREIPVVDLVAGVDGRIPDRHEGARVAVTKAIRRAIMRIGQADALIGEHLRHCVYTGSRCLYVRHVVCRRRARHWIIEAGERTGWVDHSQGMRYLAILLANPGAEIPALALAAGPGLRSMAVAAGGARSPQSVLDDAARRAYRQRLSVLQTKIDECEARSDAALASRAQAERDWLVAELKNTAGLCGRPRPFTSNDERARISVGKAIRRALDRITATDPIIGAQLRASVQTGLRCSYQPHPPNASPADPTPEPVRAAYHGLRPPHRICVDRT
jgi:hypothetical protein